MEDECFNEEELILCDWQYTVCHHNINEFKIGELVFLKSSHDLPLCVEGFDGDRVMVSWDTDEGKQRTTFLPECILQYRFSVLQVHKGWFDICYN